jgi:hypothetical protein
MGIETVDARGQDDRKKVAAQTRKNEIFAQKTKDGLQSVTERQYNKHSRQ